MKTKFNFKLTFIFMIILKIFAIIFFVFAVFSCGTTNRVHAHNMNKLPEGVILDSDGNKYPVSELLHGKLWMTTNLNLNIRNSYCYENEKENCEQFGRLYVWEAAREGCKLLGEEWRLPTNAEWLQLTKLYGGNTEDSNVIRKAAYKALSKKGTSGFNALLGGGRTPDSQYSRLDAHGFYWTITESESSTAWFYNFGKGSQALYQQQDGEKTRAFSVRCVKSIVR